MVSADPFCVAPARSSLLDHCIDNHHRLHHHHGRASAEFMLDKSSSSTSSSCSSSSPSPTPAPARSKVQPRSREVTSRYKSPTPDIASRYRSPPPSAHLSSTAARRFASPRVERSFVDATPPSKRAVSAERRRPSPTSTGLESRLASAANGDGNSALAPPRRISSNNSATRSDILWPASKNLYSSMQAEPYSSSTRSPAKTRHESRGRSSSNLSADHTLKPSQNATQKLSDQRRKTPERKGTPVRRHSSDQLENARPSEGVQPKHDQVLKHRWPSSLSILKLYGTALSKSVDLASDREKSTGRPRSSNLLHSRPTSFSSQVIPRVLPNSAGVFSHSINEGPASSVFRTTARKLNMENKSRVSGRDSPVKSRKSTPARDDGSGLSAASSRSGSSLDLVRLSEEEAELASEEYSTDNTQCGAKSASSTPTSISMTRGASVPARFFSDASTGKPRVSSYAYRLQAPTTESGYNRAVGGRQLDTRQRLTPSSETRAGHPAGPPWPGLPHHLASAYKPSHHQSLSPVRMSPVSSSMRSWPSPGGSRVSALAPLSSVSSPSRSNVYSSVLHFGADLRKSRKGLSQVEATYLHRILHNRLLQWRFANARADFSNTTHRQAGEKLLFSVWAKTAEIRKSVTSKRIKLQQARQAHKINTILRFQGAKLEEWTSIQQDHNNALSGAVEALEAAVLRVPVNEGIKADTQAVKEAVTSAVDLVHMVESSVNRLLPKMEKTNTLMSELAQVADQERTFLEECGDLLVVASSLEVEERSLRMQLLQFEQEKARVLGHLMAGNGSDSI
ncbi:hypothetical protein L7F22_011058 [Adiantum nelumboides]|nr:hypothetical protein [Adiantum nelumboides]